MTETQWIEKIIQYVNSADLGEGVGADSLNIQHDAYTTEGKPWLVYVAYEHEVYTNETEEQWATSGTGTSIYFALQDMLLNMTKDYPQLKDEINKLIDIGVELSMVAAGIVLDESHHMGAKSYRRSEMKAWLGTMNPDMTDRLKQVMKGGPDAIRKLIDEQKDKS